MLSPTASSVYSLQWHLCEVTFSWAGLTTFSLMVWPNSEAYQGGKKKRKRRSVRMVRGQWTDIGIMHTLWILVRECLWTLRILLDDTQITLERKSRKSLMVLSLTTICAVHKSCKPVSRTDRMQGDRKKDSRSEEGFKGKGSTWWKFSGAATGIV